MNQPALPSLPSHRAAGLPLLYSLRILDLLSWTRRPVTARELYLLYVEEHGEGDPTERSFQRTMRSLADFGWIECSRCNDGEGRCPEGKPVEVYGRIRAHTWRLGRIAERLMCSIGEDK